MVNNQLKSCVKFVSLLLKFYIIDIYVSTKSCLNCYLLTNDYKSALFSDLMSL